MTTTDQPVRLDLGDVCIIPLVEIETLEIQPAEFFPDLGSPGDQWWAQDPWFDRERRVLHYTIQSFLVVTPRHRILVDGCVGAGKHRSRPQFDRLPARWARELHAAGQTPNDIDVVVFSHLHVDHVGWATRGDSREPTFPRARHLLTSPELDYWTGADGREAMTRTGDYLADCIDPIRDAGLLDLVAADTRIDDHVRLRPAPGHTPGNVVVHVSASTGEVVLAGDVLHHPLQLADPRRSTRYCVDPVRATATRLALLDHCADEQLVLVPAHFAGVPGGRVTRDGDGFTWRAASDLVARGPLRPRGAFDVDPPA